MMSRFRSHLTFSNVTATVALFIALGGGAYAAARNPFVSNSGAIQGCVRNGVLDVVKLGRHCPKHSTPLPFSQVGPQGKPGIPGLQGPTGPLTGPAGGDLTGTYPNPAIAASAVGPTKFGMLPGASIVETGDQTIKSGIPTTIAFDSAEYDTDSMFDAANHRLVIHTPGKYLIEATVDLFYTGAAFAERQFSIYVDGNAVANDTQDATATPSDVDTQASSIILPLKASDTITAVVDQSTAGNATSVQLSGKTGNTEAPRLQAEWLGP